MPVDRTGVLADGQVSLPDRKLTYEEFLAWLDEDVWAEWVDGEVQIISPASESHERIATFLYFLLKLYIREKSLGRVMFAPFQVKLGPELPGREADFFFVPASRLSRLHETWFEGAPDMVAEVVSRESRGRDRGTKFYEYEAAGVREYWLLDPLREQVELYRLEESGKYRAVHLDEGGVIRSEAVPGFWFKAEWLWQNPTPAEVHLLPQLLG